MPRATLSMLAMAVAIGIATAVLAPLEAEAIPVFARRYHTSCTTCHSGGPTVLTEFGETFRDNGYRFPGDDAAFRAEPQVPLGVPARAALFPNTVWPGEIPGTVPLAILGSLGVTYVRPALPSAAATVDVPFAIRLLAGGNLGERFSAFATMGFNGTFFLGQLHVVARSLFQDTLGEMALNVKVGFFAPDILPLQPNTRRARVLPYALTSPVGRDGYTLATPSPAIEVYGLLFGRLKWVVGVANGNKPIDDVDARRDYFGRLSFTIGGPRRDYIGPSSGSSLQPNITFGASIYSGVGTNVPTAMQTFPRYRNDFVRVEGDIRFRGYGFDVLAAVVGGHDSDALVPGQRVSSASLAIDAEYHVLPWLIPYARYEEMRFDNAAFTTLRRAVAGVAAYVRANIRVRVEGVFGLSASDASAVNAELVFAM